MDRVCCEALPICRVFRFFLGNRPVTLNILREQPPPLTVSQVVTANDCKKLLREILLLKVGRNLERYVFVTLVQIIHMSTGTASNRVLSFPFHQIIASDSLYTTGITNRCVRIPSNTQHIHSFCTSYIQDVSACIAF
jgi:hypothetical protein